MKTQEEIKQMLQAKAKAFAKNNLMHTDDFVDYNKDMFASYMACANEILTNPSLYLDVGCRWVKGDYEKLYEQIEQGKRIVAYVDYDWNRNGKDIVRDITTIRNHNWGFQARGTGYSLFTGKPTIEEFIESCETLNVEWLCENTDTKDHDLEQENHTLHIANSELEFIVHAKEKEIEQLNIFLADLNNALNVLRQNKYSNQVINYAEKVHANYHKEYAKFKK